MASVMYNRGKANFVNGTVDWDTDTDLKIMLLETTTTTPTNPDHNFVSAIVADEFSDTNYTGGFGGAGRKTLASKAVNQDDTNDRAECDAADVTWTALGGTSSVVGAVIFKEITNDASSPLICFIDLADTATNGGDFTIQWNAEGIIQLA